MPPSGPKMLAIASAGFFVFSSVYVTLQRNQDRDDMRIAVHKDKERIRAHYEKQLEDNAAEYEALTRKSQELRELQAKTFQTASPAYQPFQATVTINADSAAPAQPYQPFQAGSALQQQQQQQPPVYQTKQQ